MFEQQEIEWRDPELVYANIELTNICNLKCSVCWSQTPHLRQPRPKGFMKKEDFHRILNELSTFNVNHMKLGLSYAGESTLHPDFSEFSKDASQVGFEKLQLATNGTTLTPELCKVIAECYDQIAVSFHKSPLLPKVIENTRMLHHECRKTGHTMRVNIVQQEFTPQEIGKLQRMTLGFRDSCKVFGMITENMRKTAPGWNIGKCPMLPFYIAVLWNGETLPCCHMLSPGDFTLGNVLKTSIHDVFMGSKITALREGHLEGTPCQACNVYL